MTSAEEYNINLAKRQTEVNEWTYGNKMDTLFVFQLVFISLLFVIILLVLKGQGLLGDPFVWYSIFIVIFLDVIIIINRFMYSMNKRDSRYWNRKNFSEDNNKVSPLARGDTSYQAYIDSVRTTYKAPESKCVCPTPPKNC
jgi:hypothetical protein